MVGRNRPVPNRDGPRAGRHLGFADSRDGDRPGALALEARRTGLPDASRSRLSLRAPPPPVGILTWRDFFQSLARAQRTAR